MLVIIGKTREEEVTGLVWLFTGMVAGSVIIARPNLGMTGNVAAAIGTVPIADNGSTRFGVVTVGGTTGGVEVVLKSGAIGVCEGCTFGAGTGAT